MQVDSFCLTRAERQRRIQQRLCLYCGGEEHVIAVCPIRPPRPAVSTVQVPTRIAPLTRTKVILMNSHVCVSAQALIDSGSAGNFISTQVLQKLNIHRNRCQQNLQIQTIQGKPLGRGRITHFSPTLTLRIGCLHLEDITFVVLEGSTGGIYC